MATNFNRLSQSAPMLYKPVQQQAPTPTPSQDLFKAPTKGDATFNSLWEERVALSQKLGLYNDNFVGRGALNIDKLLTTDITSDNYKDFARWVELGGNVKGSLERIMPDYGSGEGWQPNGAAVDDRGAREDAMNTPAPNTGEGWDPSRDRTTNEELEREPQYRDTRQWENDNTYNQQALELMKTKLETYDLSKEAARTEYRAKMMEEYNTLLNSMRTRSEMNFTRSRNRASSQVNTYSEPQGGMNIPR